MRAVARERSSQLIAEFNTQSARIYSFDDEIRKEAALAARVAEQASEVIAARCREFGIPPDFAPGVSFGWYDRGQNAVATRRAELRSMASPRSSASASPGRPRPSSVVSSRRPPRTLSSGCRASSRSCGRSRAG